MVFITFRNYSARGLAPISRGKSPWTLPPARGERGSIRQELVPRELLGRVTAAARTIFVSATPVGALIAGLGTRAAGNDPRPMFLGAGCLLALAIAVAWFSTLRHQVAYQVAPAPAKAGAVVELRGAVTAGRTPAS